MAESRVLVPDSGKGKRSLLGTVPDKDKAWWLVGWLGIVLLVVGIGDFFLGWYPTNFGSPEWEFATVVSTFSGLPLVTMGFAAMLGSAMARGRKVTLLITAVGLALFTLFLAAAFLIFLLDVPLALGAVEGVAALGVKKAIFKTALIAVAFGGGYAITAIVILKHLTRKERLADA